MAASLRTSICLAASDRQHDSQGHCHGGAPAKSALPGETSRQGVLHRRFVTVRIRHRTRWNGARDGLHEGSAPAGRVPQDTPPDGCQALGLLAFALRLLGLLCDLNDLTVELDAVLARIADERALAATKLLPIGRVR